MSYTILQRAVIRKHILVFFVLTLIVRGSSWTLPFQRDAIGYAYNGREIVNGAVLYRDMWDHKPPAIYFLNAAVYKTFPTFYLQSLRIVSLLSSFLSAVFLFYLLRHFFAEKVAGLTTAFYAIFSNVYFLTVGDNLVEGYMLPILVCCYYSFIKKRYFLSGIFLGILFLFKQVGILPLGALIFHLITEKKYKALTPLILIGMGIALSLLPFVYYVEVNGIVKETWDAIYTYNVIYSRQPMTIASMGQSLYYATQVVLGALPFWVLAAVGLAQKKYLRTDILFLLLFLFSLIGTAMGGKFAFTRHYFLLVFPALSYFVAKSFDALAHQKFLTFFVAGLILPSVIMQGQVVLSGLYYADKLGGSQKEMQYLLGLPQYNFVEEQKLSQRVITYLKQYVREGDYIVDWGAEPELYVLTDTAAPTRYYYNFPLNGVFISGDPKLPERRRVFMSEIEKNKPSIIIVNKEATKHQSSFEELDFLEFKKFIGDHYSSQVTIGNFIIFRL